MLHRKDFYSGDMRTGQMKGSIELLLSIGVPMCRELLKITFLRGF